MSLTPKHTLEDVSRIVDYIEAELDRHIWKTRARIQECILQRYPKEKNNPSLMEPKIFLYLLLSFLSNGSALCAQGKIIFLGGERFEEGKIEPILFEDISLTDNDTEYTALGERMYAEGLSKGKSWETIRNYVSLQSQYFLPNMITDLRQNGVSSTQVFYKLPHGSLREKDSPLPQLPMEVI